VFGNNITINTTALGASQSTNPTTFCSQIIDSSIYPTFGTSPLCKFIYHNYGIYELRITLSSDATFGNSQPSILQLKSVFQVNNGCVGGISTSYQLLSLPIEQPSVVFRETAMSVPLCSDKFILDIFSSKGITARDSSSITWDVVSIDAATTSAERNTLHSYVSANFINMKFIKLNETSVAGLSGKVVEFRATITNFLGHSSSSTILVTFANSKKIMMQGLFSSYNMVDYEDNKMFLSARIPYCSGDNKAAILVDTAAVVLACELYQSDAVTLVSSLTNCKIPSGTMAFPSWYNLKVTATHPSDPTQNSEEWSYIYTRKSSLSVFIHGGDRSIQVDYNNIFSATVYPSSANVVYRWS
jgi:hypothetical protein